MTLWMVRAGRYGQSEDYALENDFAVVGWEDVPDLSAYANRQDLASALRDIYPDEKPKTLTNWESQLWPFAHEMVDGDIVILPLKSKAAIAIGVVSGPYRYQKGKSEVIHVRPVQWKKQVPRTTFAQDLLYSFGSIMTVCRISRNNAEARVRAVMEGHANEPHVAPMKEEPCAATNGANGDTELPDIEQAARDRISNHIGMVFKGHKLAALVQALMEAEGYSTELSPPGADGGVDILAGKGAFGFDAPRLVVQVKSQDTPVDVAILRELQGVMAQFSVDQGLLVAWGGVTKALSRESKRQFFKIRIWDAGDILNAVLQQYDRLPEDIRAELPLKRIWVISAPTENIGA